MRLNAAAHDTPVGAVRDLAAALVRAGCQGLYFAEIAHDPFLPAAACAGATDLTLGTAIALAFPRSPTALAYTAYDLAAATGGRFVLGLGAQVKPHMERRYGLHWERPVDRMREVVGAIRAVWQCWASGDALRYEGEFFRLSLMPPAFRPAPSPHPPPSIYLAAVGPAMARLAGEVADGLFVHAFATPGYVRRVIIPAVEEGVQRSGRARSEFQICYSALIAHGTTPDQLRQARQATRQTVAFHASTPAYRPVLDTHGRGDLQPALRRLTQQGAWDTMATQIDDDVLDLFCISGTPVEVCEQIGQRWGSLIDQVSLPIDLWTSQPDDPAWKAATDDLKSWRILP